MSKQLFNNPKGHRGAAVVTIPMHVLYDLLHARIERIPGSFDADAVCQNICVEIEKQQGTYPNVEGMTLADVQRKQHGYTLHELPPSRISSREHDMRSKSERALQQNVRANYEAFSAMRNDINEIIGNMPSQESALLEGPEMAHECAQIVEAVRAYAGTGPQIVARLETAWRSEGNPMDALEAMFLEFTKISEEMGKDLTP